MVRGPDRQDHDVAAIEGEVARFSAGLDLLADRVDVDPDRLAVVGHDFGAMLASIVAAREDRVRAAVLIAPTPRWGDWFLPFWEIHEDRSRTCGPSSRSTRRPRWHRSRPDRSCSSWPNATTSSR